MSAGPWLKDTAYRGLLDDVVSNPDDDTPRLVLADWHEERGHDTRARFIRLQVGRSRLPAHDRRRWETRAEEVRLLAANGDEWLGRLKAIVTEAEWRRGFVEQASLGVSRMAKNAAELFALTPLYHLHILRLSQSKVSPTDLGRIDALKRTRSLCLRGSGLPDAHVAAILLAVGFPALEALDLTWTGFGPMSANALRLLAPPRLRTLLVPGSCRRDQMGDLLATLSAIPFTEMDLSRGSWSPADAAALAAWPGLANVRRLALSHLDHLGEAAWQRLLESPRLGPLEALDLAHSSIGPAGVHVLASNPRLAGLRSLDLENDGLGDTGAAALAGSGLDGIEVLRLRDNGLTGFGLERLAQWPGLAGVRVLSLRGNHIGNAGLEALLASPHLGPLVSLDLASTGLTKDAAGLLESSTRLASLAHLNLLSSGLGQAGLARLKKAAGLAGVVAWGNTGLGDA